MQPRALMSHLRTVVVEELAEVEADLVPAIARLSPRWAWYLCAALTRVQEGLSRGDGVMGAQQQDFGLGADATLIETVARYGFHFGHGGLGEHQPGRHLTPDEHARLHLALALAERMEREGHDVDEAAMVLDAAPPDVKGWALNLLHDGPGDPQDALGVLLVRVLRAERGRWRDLAERGVR